MALNRYYARVPNLKSNVDVQLRSAFTDHNWIQVVRLAEKRAKSLKDPYYEVMLEKKRKLYTLTLLLAYLSTLLAYFTCLLTVPFS